MEQGRRASTCSFTLVRSSRVALGLRFVGQCFFSGQLAQWIFENAATMRPLGFRIPIGVHPRDPDTVYVMPLEGNDAHMSGRSTRSLAQ